MSIVVPRWPAPQPEPPPDVVEALARALGEALAAQFQEDTGATVETRSGINQRRSAAADPMDQTHPLDGRP